MIQGVHHPWQQDKCCDGVVWINESFFIKGGLPPILQQYLQYCYLYHFSPSVNQDKQVDQLCKETKCAEAQAYWLQMSWCMPQQITCRHAYIIIDLLSLVSWVNSLWVVHRRQLGRVNIKCSDHTTQVVTVPVGLPLAVMQGKPLYLFQKTSP